MSENVSIGTQIKLARIKQDLTATEFARRIGVSPSMVSKIEHNVINPSLDVLRKIAMELHVSVGDLVVPDDGPSAGPHLRPSLERRVSLVRARDRKRLQLPSSGIVYQLLTPDLQGQAEFVWVELDPGQGGTQSITHQHGEEYTLVIAGQLTVSLDQQEHVLNPGDCIIFDARIPHCYANRGTEKATWVYLSIPPSL